MPQNTYPEKVDISNCEKEPIHIIGKSQAHGVIVACDKNNLKITQIGKNTDEYFGIPYNEILSEDLSCLIGVKAAENLRNEIKLEEQLEVRELNINDRDFILIPHISGESLIIDFGLRVIDG